MLWVTAERLLLTLGRRLQPVLKTEAIELQRFRVKREPEPEYEQAPAVAPEDRAVDS